ncbi:hypothetical protein TNCV_2945261 [Trichonephila clavipes]|nr:hypothetical protein TNCV_2945261 [Trichonephila clavipes]
MSVKTVEKQRKRPWGLYLMLRKGRYKAWIDSDEALFHLSFTIVKTKIQYISSKKCRKDAAALKKAKKKLSNLNNSYKSEFNSGFKNAIVDLNVLAGVFSEAVKCLQCGATGLNLSCEENCSGGAVELDIICDICSYSYHFCSSKKCKAEIGKPSTYEVNTRLVYAMRCIGKVQKLHECFAES